MESLFDKDYVNTQPLRKYEPLIRFDLEGNPQPRRPLKDAPQTSSALKEAVEPPKPKPSPPKPEDLKRKVNDAPAPGMEPKKKQQKQTSIMNFFKKCD